jgi:hypothetical protein
LPLVGALLLPLACAAATDLLALPGPRRLLLLLLLLLLLRVVLLLLLAVLLLPRPLPAVGVCVPVARWRPKTCGGLHENACENNSSNMISSSKGNLVIDSVCVSAC